MYGYATPADGYDWCIGCSKTMKTHKLLPKSGVEETILLCAECREGDQ